MSATVVRQRGPSRGGAGLLVLAAIAAAAGAAPAAWACNACVEDKIAAPATTCQS